MRVRQAETGDIEMSQNEWANVSNLRDGYLPCGVYDFPTPRLWILQVRDAFAKLPARSRAFSTYGVTESALRLRDMRRPR